MPAPRVLSQRIIDLRWRRARLSQRAFAEKAGLTQSYLSKVERGARTPSPEALGRIADALGITVDELLADPETDADRVPA